MYTVFFSQVLIWYCDFSVLVCFLLKFQLVKTLPTSPSSSIFKNHSVSKRKWIYFKHNFTNYLFNLRTYLIQEISFAKWWNVKMLIDISARMSASSTPRLSWAGTMTYGKSLLLWYGPGSTYISFLFAPDCSNMNVWNFATRKWHNILSLIEIKLCLKGERVKFPS